MLITKGDGALERARGAAEKAIGVLPGGKVDGTELLPSGVAAAAFVESRLAASAAASRIDPLRQALGPTVLVTGDAAIQHDLGPVLAHDLRVGELYLAVPVALLILLLVFGTASAVLPFLFAAATIAPALGIAWGVAHVLELSDYLRNMMLMIGLGIAIDYSLLVVSRYRDERRRGVAHEEAVVETMVHAGRTIVFSGLAVSVGLALMLLLPVPFLRGFGVGGLLIPLVSIACALTLLPVMLLTFGRQLERVRIIPQGLAERRHVGETRLWAAHARWVMRRAKFFAPVVATLLVLAAMPLIGIRVGPGSYSSLPTGIAAMRGLTILEHSTTRHSLDPTTVIVDTHRAGGVRTLGAAVGRLDRMLRADREVVTVSPALAAGDGRYLRIDVVGRHDPASPQAQAFADRLRSSLIPASGFLRSMQVIAGGGGASATDFVSRTLGSFPWLILGVLALTYLLLVRAFRSLLLPLKAIVLNLLTVAAASGLMIAVFQWGWGELGRVPPGRPDRRLDPGLHVHSPVRALDGLRGLPRYAHERSLGPDAVEHGRGRARAREHRPDRHGCGADHDRDVQRLPARLDPADAAARLRTRHRDPARHHPRPWPAAPVDDGACGPLELVPPRLDGASSADQPLVPRAGRRSRGGLRSLGAAQSHPNSELPTT